MPTICAVATCKNSTRYKTSGIVFHSFPKDTKLKKLWLFKCKRADRKSVIPLPGDRICSFHFSSEDYKRDLRNELLNLPLRKFLKEDAVPSLNLKNLPTATSSSNCRAVRACRRKKQSLFQDDPSPGKVISPIFPLKPKGKSRKQNERVANPPQNIKTEDKSGKKNRLLKRGRMQLRQQIPKGKSRKQNELVDNPLKNIKTEDKIGNKKQLQSGYMLSHSISQSKEYSNADDKDIVIDQSNKNIRILSVASNIPEDKVTHLILNDNAIENLPTISNFLKLTKISLANNRVNDLGWFSLVPCLKVLDVSNNNISSIKALSHLYHLTHINLSGNKITSLYDFQPRQNRQNFQPLALEYLDLSNNQICELASFKSLIKLKELMLGRNKISSLKTKLGNKDILPTSVRHITLADNLLSNLLDFTILSSLGQLETITVKNNPCTSDSLFVSDKNGKFISSVTCQFRLYLLVLCPFLKHIDDVAVTKFEIANSKKLIDDDMEQKLQDNSPTLLLIHLSKTSTTSTSKIDINPNIYEISSEQATINKNRITFFECREKSFNYSPPKGDKLKTRFFYAPNTLQNSQQINKDALQNSLAADKVSTPTSITHNEDLNSLPMACDDDDDDDDDENEMPAPESNNLNCHDLDQQCDKVQEPSQLYSTFEIQSPMPPMESDVQGCGQFCSHYVSLIEEKARSYKLQRTLDNITEKLPLMSEINKQLVKRCQELEELLLLNGIPFEVKVEVEDIDNVFEYEHI